MAEAAKSGETSTNLTKRVSMFFALILSFKKRPGLHFHDHHLDIFNADSDAEI